MRISSGDPSGVAQLEERLTVNQNVGSSSLAPGAWVTIDDGAASAAPSARSGSGSGRDRPMSRDGPWLGRSDRRRSRPAGWSPVRRPASRGPAAGVTPPPPPPPPRPRPPTAQACPDLPGHQPVEHRRLHLPVHTRSAAWVASIGSSTKLHPDFGTFWDGAPIGIPFVHVGAGQPKVPVSFEYAEPERPGPVPDPPQRADRGRTGERRGPPRARDRRRRLQALRALRRLPAGRRHVVGRRARAPSSTSRPTPSARTTGPPPTPPACRSTPAWCATTRWWGRA